MWAYFVTLRVLSLRNSCFLTFPKNREAAQISSAPLPGSTVFFRVIAYHEAEQPSYASGAAGSRVENAVEKVEDCGKKCEKTVIFGGKALHFPGFAYIIRLKNNNHRREDRSNMCQKIKELHDMTPADLLKKTNQTGVFPVDVAQICYKMGIRLMPFDFSQIEMQAKRSEGRIECGDVLGAVVAKDNDLAILYKKDDLVNNRRFTIAHEIAHSCLHMEPDSAFHIEFRTALRDGNESEKEANAFARRLLIPSDVLRGMLGETRRIEPKAVPMLSSLFMVSEDVMQERLRDFDVDIVEPLPQKYVRRFKNVNVSLAQSGEKKPNC